MKTKTEDRLFGVFGLGCKAIFHVLGLLAAYRWNINLFIFLLGLIVLHNTLTLCYTKHRTGDWLMKVKIENWK